MILTRGAADLRFDFPVPFPDDAFRVGLHPSLPSPVMIGGH